MHPHRARLCLAGKVLVLNRALAASALGFLVGEVRTSSIDVLKVRSHEQQVARRQPTRKPILTRTCRQPLTFRPRSP
jgi:hypothetical protein